MESHVVTAYVRQIEQLKQKEQKSRTAITFRVDHAYSGSTFPITFGCRTCCCPPCCGEGRMAVADGDTVLVTRAYKWVSILFFLLGFLFCNYTIRFTILIGAGTMVSWSQLQKRIIILPLKVSLSVVCYLFLCISFISEVGIVVLSNFFIYLANIIRPSWEGLSPHIYTLL